MNIGKSGSKTYSPTRQAVWLVVVFGLIFIFSMLRLESTPPLWWDEGWTLTVARHWVESGHYGQFLSGEPASGGLEAAFPLTAPLALSFRLLGVGVWQGRLVGVLFTLAAVALLFFLSARLYSRKTAWGTLFVLIFMTGHPQINTLLNGRQVLADVPVVFFLLSGYALGWLLWRKSWLSLPLASLFWGFAIIAKAQTLPFLLVGLGIPFGLSLVMRRWRSALWFGLSVPGAWLASKALGWFWDQALTGHTLPHTAVQALRSLVAIVPDASLRSYAVSMALLFALPLASGLLWQGWRFWRESFWRLEDERLTLWKLSLWSLAGSWFAWYLLLSNGGERYLATPAALGSMFAAGMLCDFTGGCQVRCTLNKVGVLLTGKDRSLAAIQGMFALLLVVYSLVITSLTYWITWRSSDSSAQIVATMLNQHMPPESLVESYDSEIFFFLHQPYHYPPDVVHGELLRRYLLDPTHPVDYDPLAAAPDYLVVGPVSAKWRLYDDAIASGAFTPILQQGSYTIYERANP